MRWCLRLWLGRRGGAVDGHVGEFLGDEESVGGDDDRDDEESEEEGEDVGEHYEPTCGGVGWG